jgi:proprotein convertase subtilisin/kexin type 5
MPDCSAYSGVCDPKCSLCNGPSSLECVGCLNTSGIAVPNDGKLCMCKGQYVGPACEYYTGKCNPRCVGCFGPEDTDCFTCSLHASWSTEGACECIPGWIGDNCMKPSHFCHPSCHTCFGPDAGNCTTCFPGFYLTVNHYCEECGCGGRECIFDGMSILCQCSFGEYWDYATNS